MRSAHRTTSHTNEASGAPSRVQELPGQAVASPTYPDLSTLSQQDFLTWQHDFALALRSQPAPFANAHNSAGATDVEMKFDHSSEGNAGSHQATAIRAGKKRNSRGMVHQSAEVPSTLDDYTAWQARHLSQPVHPAHGISTSFHHYPAQVLTLGSSLPNSVGPSPMSPSFPTPHLAQLSAQHHEMEPPTSVAARTRSGNLERPPSRDRLRRHGRNQSLPVGMHAHPTPVQLPATRHAPMARDMQSISGHAMEMPNGPSDKSSTSISSGMPLSAHTISPVTAFHQQIASDGIFLEQALDMLAANPEKDIHQAMASVAISGHHLSMQSQNTPTVSPMSPNDYSNSSQVALDDKRLQMLSPWNGLTLQQLESQLLSLQHAQPLTPDHHVLHGGETQHPHAPPYALRSREKTNMDPPATSMPDRAMGMHKKDTFPVQYAQSFHLQRPGFPLLSPVNLGSPIDLEMQSPGPHTPSTSRSCDYMYFKGRSPYGPPDGFSGHTTLAGSSRSSSVTSSSGFTGSQEAGYFPSPGTVASFRDARKKSKLSLRDRRSICEYHLANPDAKQETIAHQFGVERSTVSKVLRQKDKWLSDASSLPTPRTQKPRMSKYPQVESALMAWIGEQEPGIFLTDTILREQALQLAKTLGLTEDVFKASAGWVEKFKVRNNIDGGKYAGSRLKDSEKAAIETVQEASQNTADSLSMVPSHGSSESSAVEQILTTGVASASDIPTSCSSPPKTHHYALRQRQHHDSIEGSENMTQRVQESTPGGAYRQSNTFESCAEHKFDLSSANTSDLGEPHLRRHTSAESAGSVVSSMTDYTAANTETASTTLTSCSASSQSRVADSTGHSKRPPPRTNQSLADALGPAFAKAVNSSSSFTDLASKVSSEKHISMPEAQGALNTVMRFLSQQPRESFHTDNKALGDLWSKFQGLGNGPGQLEDTGQGSKPSVDKSRSISPPARPSTPVQRQGRSEQLMTEAPNTRRRSRLRQHAGHGEGESTP